MDKVAELVKAGKLREISDMRDETDLNGLKLAIDLKRGVEPEQAYAEALPHDAAAGQLCLQLQHSDRRHAARDAACGEILDEWIAWRLGCVRRRVYFRRIEEEGKAPSSQRSRQRSCSTSTSAISIIREHGARERRCAESDDRLRHRPGTGRVSSPRSSCATSTANTSSSAPRRPTSSNARSPSWRIRSRAAASCARSSFPSCSR